MSDNPLSSKVGLDTTDFKTAIAQMNRELRVVESGFRASAAALGNWSKDASGLEMRIKALNSEMDLQRVKVDVLAREYERVAKEKGATSRAAQDLQVRLNKETETLNKMGVELDQSQKALDGMGKEADQAGAKVEDLGEQEEQTTRSTERLKAVMGGLGTALKAGVAAIAAVGAAAAAAASGIARMVLSAADTAGELVDLSAQTGISVERLQELSYVGDQVGVSTETMTGGMARLIRSMSSAREGNEQTAAAFAALGISVTDSNGQLRDSEAVFQDAITALGGISNETERDALAMELFGKSAQDLNPLIKAGADEINRLTDEAHEMGAVMDDEAVGALESFGDELAGLQAGLKGTLGTLAVAFLPFFQEITGQAKGYMQEFAAIVSGADGDLGEIATGLGELLGKIITDVAQQAPAMLEAGLSILRGIGSAIMAALPELIPAAVEMITSLVAFVVEALPLLMDAGVQILLALINAILPQLPMLIEAGLQMIVTLANGLAAALPQLIPVIAQIIPQIVIILIQNLPMIIQAALDLIIALAQGLIAALPVLIPQIPKIVEAIVQALIEAFPMIIEAALQLIITLGQGIIAALPQLGQSALEIITTIGTALQNANGRLLEFGGNIVRAIWEGIQALAGWFADNVGRFFGNIVSNAISAITGNSGTTTSNSGAPDDDQAGPEQSGGGGIGPAGGVLGVGSFSQIDNATAAFNAGGASGGGMGSGPGGKNVYITVNAQVNGEIDEYRLANTLAGIIRRNG